MGDQPWFGRRATRTLRVKSQARNGFLLLCQNDPTRAESFFRQAITEAPPALIPDIAIGLGSALILGGKWAQAAPLCEAALLSRSAVVRAQGRVNLGICKSHLDDLPGAMDLWARVVSDGPKLVAAYGHVCIGETFVRAGDLDDARPHLEMAYASAVPEVVACAQANLGRIHALNDDIATAQGLWASARHSGYVSASSLAEYFIGLQLYKDGDIVAATAFLTSVITTGYPDSAEDAQCALQRIADGTL